jgi:cytochrome c oxidase cbb3-type subunit 3
VSWKHFVVAACALLAASCEREARRYQEPAASAVTPKGSEGARLQAGGVMKAESSSNPAEANAYAVAQGKRLFGWYNCVGCHAHGGGGSGPALMDDKWLYGHEPANVFASIVEGRPNGMPAFGGRIPESQVWQLVGYVRSMSGLVRADVAPGRDDNMQAVEPENRREKGRPTTGGAAVP